MKYLHSRLMSTGLALALSAGSFAAVSSSAFAADERIQTNASGEVVSHTSTAALQRALAAHHAYSGKIDGVWGAQTQAALRQFQSSNQLETTGRLDEPTAKKLGVSIERMDVGDDAKTVKTDKDDAKTVKTDKTDTPRTDAVGRTSDEAHTSVQLSALNNSQAKEMQQRLQLLGYYKGPIDGELGEGTRSALRKFFQHQADLASKGIVSNAAISLFGTQPNAIQPVNGTDKH
jgi:peptidoglycan hydrolase-like protein with peptidoglycan-binding domain